MERIIPEAYLTNNEKDTGKKNEATSMSDIEDKVEHRVLEDVIAGKRRWGEEPLDEQCRKDIAEAIATLYRYYPTIIFVCRSKQEYDEHDKKLSRAGNREDFLYRGCLDENVHRWSICHSKEGGAKAGEPLSPKELLGDFLREVWRSALEDMIDRPEGKDVEVVKDMLVTVADKITRMVSTGVDFSKEAKNDPDFIVLITTIYFLVFPEMGDSSEWGKALKETIFNTLFGKE